MKEDEFKDGQNFSYHIEDVGASCLDPDIDLSYIDVKLQDVLGHLQKDFEGAISTENLGAKFGKYGSFLHSYQRSPLWSQSMSSQKGLQQVLSKPPINRSPFEVKLSKHGGRSERPEKCSKDVTCLSGSRARSSPLEAIESPEQKHLKIRIKIGCDDLRQKNAAIYSGLGLDNSPSPLDCSSESEGISNEPYGSVKHFTDIIKIMAVLPVEGVLMSPLTDKLIQLSDRNWCRNEITSTQDRKPDGSYEAVHLDTIPCDDLLRNTFKSPVLSVSEGLKAASKKKSKVDEGKHPTGIVDKSQMYLEKEAFKQIEEKKKLKDVEANRSSQTRLSRPHENIEPLNEPVSFHGSEGRSEQKEKIVVNQCSSWNQVDVHEDDGVAGSSCDLILQNSEHDLDNCEKEILTRQKEKINAVEIICNDYHIQRSISVRTSTSMENDDINIASVPYESGMKCGKYHGVKEEKNKKKTKLCNGEPQRSSENDDKQLKKKVKISPEFDSSNASERVKKNRAADEWTLDDGGIFNNNLSKGFHQRSSGMVLESHDEKNEKMDSCKLLKTEQITSFDEKPIDEDADTSFRETVEISVGHSGTMSGIINATRGTKDCSGTNYNVEKKARASKFTRMETSSSTRVPNSLNAKLKAEDMNLYSTNVKSSLPPKNSAFESAKDGFDESRHIKNKECTNRMISEKVSDDGRNFEGTHRSDKRNSEKMSSLRIAERNQLCASDQCKAKIADQSPGYERKQMIKKNIDEKSLYSVLENEDSTKTELSLLPKASKEETCTKSPSKSAACVLIDASPPLKNPLQQSVKCAKALSASKHKSSLYEAPVNKHIPSSTIEVNKDDKCKGIPVVNKLRNGDCEPKTSVKRNYSNQAASNSIKEAKSLKHMADRLKSERAFAESTRLYFESSLKFLYGASLLENCDNAGGGSSYMTQSTQMYNSTAELCKFCAHEYEKSKDIGAAALAYKCMEVAYMRVLYHSHHSCNKGSHELQVALQMVPPDGGNHVIAARSRTDLERLLRFVGNVDGAMEASRKSLSALSAIKSMGNRMQEETRLLIKSAIDFNFNDVEAFMRLVRVAFDSLTNHFQSL